MIGRPSKPPLVDNDDDDGGYDDVDEAHGGKCYFDGDMKLMKLIEGKNILMVKRNQLHKPWALRGVTLPSRRRRRWVPVLEFICFAS